MDALTWYWPFWNRKVPWLCLVAYSGSFCLFVQIYLRAQLMTAAILCAAAVCAAIVSHIILTKRKMI